MEAESKAETAEAEAERLQGLLSAYDRNAAQEQALIVKAAEAEMDAMRRELDRGADEWRSASTELEGCREREVRQSTITLPLLSHTLSTFSYTLRCILYTPCNPPSPVHVLSRYSSNYCLSDANNWRSHYKTKRLTWSTSKGT